MWFVFGLCFITLALGQPCTGYIDISVDNYIGEIWFGQSFRAGSQIPNYNNWQIGGRTGIMVGDFIAVSGYNEPGEGTWNPAAIILSLTITEGVGYPSNVIHSDTSWKCRAFPGNQPPTGWNTRDFDDSSWPFAVSYGQYGVGPWGRVPGINASSTWIWDANTYAGGKAVFCRKKNFCNVNECTYYGDSSKPGVASCVQGPQARTITCRAGFEVSGTTSPSASVPRKTLFSGCVAINECTRYGYAPAGAANVANCVDQDNARTITCNTGYYAVGTNFLQSITLAGSTGFQGCVVVNPCTRVSPPSARQTCTPTGNGGRTYTCDLGFYLQGTNYVTSVTYNDLTSVAPPCIAIDECVRYGNNGQTTGYSRCVDGQNSRTIYCMDGYYPIGQAQTTNAIVLPGATSFSGCAVVDMCAVYSTAPNPANAACQNLEVNKRRITCSTGFYASAPATSSIDLVGPVPFGGCKDIDECSVYPSVINSVCVNGGLNQRIITCNAGFYIQNTDMQTSITLTGSTTFVGCVDINECTVYGYSKNADNTLSCDNLVNSRKITCNAGYNPVGSPLSSSSVTLVGSATFQGCVATDMCALYGYSNNAANTKSCVTGINQRTITCNDGYYAVAPSTLSVTLTGNAVFQGCTKMTLCSLVPSNLNSTCTEIPPNSRVVSCLPGYYITGTDFQTSITLAGTATFPGCIDIDECTRYGFNGKQSNTTNCENLVNSRKINCKLGYHVVGLAESVTSVTLTGSQAFTGCKLANMCTLYGVAPNPANAQCIWTEEMVNTRRVTCNTGYSAVAGSTEPSVVLTGSATFGGCIDINECEIYGFGNNRANTLKCETTSLNTRTITCLPGYYAVAPSTPSITLTGSAAFNGCTDIKECDVYGNNGQTNFVKSCDENGLINQRRITCQDGYFAEGGQQDSNTIILTGAATFAGCALRNTCTIYGYSGKPNNTKDCVAGVNVRTITCKTGYIAEAPDKASVTLTGDAQFQGCTEINECSLYGTNNNNANVKGCTDLVGGRLITCVDGYFVVGTNTQPSVKLDGNAAFTGCIEINECNVYAFSNKADNTKACQDLVNGRKITCADGYYVVGRAQTVSEVTLTGNAPFTGCARIEMCATYGAQPNPAHATCAEAGVNQRTITCAAGYAASAPDKNSVTLTGPVTFSGCVDIDECSVYGSKPNTQNVKGCENVALNQRKVTCSDGFIISGTRSDVSVVLTGSATFPGCIDLDECAVYGLGANTANVQGCENLVNSRKITCVPGYSPIGGPETSNSVTLIGSTTFSGCRQVDMCSVYGFSSKPDHTVNCVGGVNTRTITCETGYYAVAPDVNKVTLTGNEVFAGCKDIDECAIYGFNSNGQNTMPCENLLGGGRKITCSPGYFVLGTETQTSVILNGNAQFPGCVDINECTLYGYSNQATNTESCDNLVNSRRITCRLGYSVVGSATYSRSIVLTGNAGFPGCTIVNLCEVLGYNGKTANTKSCTYTANERTITCNTGFYAKAPSSPSVTLIGTETFAGCMDINECDLFGMNGRGQNTAGCENGSAPNTRKITCAAGYYVFGSTTWETSVTLVGSDEFPGCREINECEVYGYSGKTGNVDGCKDTVNGRIITCQPGYKVGDGESLASSMEIKGNAPFPGCFDINECRAYGFSNKLAFTFSCENGLNKRIITCMAGYYAVAPSQKSITLTGDAPFLGCKEIDECAVYGYNGNSNGAFACKDGINQRDITCNYGFYAVPPNQVSITLTGSQTFGGCHDIKECNLYGFSNKSAHTVSCDEPVPGKRTITCEVGFAAIEKNRSITIDAGLPFAGCKPICADGLLVEGEECDDGNTEHGDGCSPTCMQEDGFACNPSFPGACCSELDGSLADFGLGNMLQCVDGFWMGRGPGGGSGNGGNGNGDDDDDGSFNPIIAIDRQDATLVIPEGAHLRLCGELRVGYQNGNTGAGLQFRDQEMRWRHRQIVIEGVLEIAGYVTVHNDGVLAFAPGGQLIITEECEAGSLNLQNALQVMDTGVIAIEGVGAISEAPPTVAKRNHNGGGTSSGNGEPYIVANTSKCIFLDGGFYLQADQLPTGSIDWPLLWSSTDCWIGKQDDDDQKMNSAFNSLDHLLPGHCSNIETRYVGGQVMVQTNKKDLCDGEMSAIGITIIAVAIGIVVILIAVLVAVSAGAIGGAASGPGSAEGHYVAL